MFAPAILPLQLTVVFVLVSILISVAVLPRFGHRHGKVLSYSCFAAIILFLPSCLGIGFLVDLVRYGRFSFSTASDVSDSHVELPPEATEITLFKYAAGHDARFRVSSAALKRWMDEVSADRDDGRTRIKVSPRAGFPERFMTHGWKLPADVDQYQGPVSPRGAGFCVWHSPDDGFAYLSATYW